MTRRFLRSAASSCTLIAIAVSAAGCAVQMAEGQAASTSGDQLWAVDKFAEIPKGGYVDVPFRVSGPAKISFSVTSRATVAPDRFDLGIIEDSQMQLFKSGQSLETLLWKSNVSDTAGTFDVPAGDYHFLVRCGTLLGGCAFSYSLSSHL